MFSLTEQKWKKFEKICAYVEKGGGASPETDISVKGPKKIPISLGGGDIYAGKCL